MPEIKNTFTQGKMNKDLDERIIPNGQYRDAMNVQVSTSEGSDVGTVQNILGNTRIGNIVDDGWECVGSIADEKNDKFYSFIANVSGKNAIIEYAKDPISGAMSGVPVLVDLNNGVLNFSQGDIITGINVIDEFILWTDGKNEPKKINIERCKLGTTDFLTHTKLIVGGNEVAGKTENRLANMTFTSPGPITPATPLGGIINITLFSAAGLEVGDELTGIRNFNFNQPYREITAISGNTITLSSEILFSSYVNINDNLVFNRNADIAEEHITVIKKKPLRPLSVKINPADTKDKAPLFEKIFPRFSYRYRYEDGEYSALAPFTDVIFNSLYPDDQDGIPHDETTAYGIKEPYNKGMRNMIQSIELYDFVTPTMPKDVIQVDILYKQEDSNTIHVIEVIKNIDIEWNEDGIAGATSDYKGKFVVQSENIYAALPTNQLLRPWDNVPKTAKAQEITGNRVVYGNYTQGYDMNRTPKIMASHKLRFPYITPPYLGGGLPSVKSQRNYQLGVVYGDKYGRETPVFTSSESSVVIPWEDNASLTPAGVNYPLASFSLQLRAHIESMHPKDANGNDIFDYYKFFVKETSGEYYNLIMDTMWNVTKSDFKKDEHIWLSFASSDRNKISKDDYIILKKRATESTQTWSYGILPENKFRILDVKNEAPNAIKFAYNNIGEISNTPITATSDGILTTQIFDTPDLGIVGTAGNGNIVRNLHINKTNWFANGGGMLIFNDDGRPLDDPIYFSFTKAININENQHSGRYKVATVRTEDVGGVEKYIVKLAKNLSSEDMDLAEDDTHADTIDGNLIVRFETKMTRNLESFSGRFFVKILSNSLTRDVLQDVTGAFLNQNSNTTVQTDGSADVFYLANKRTPASYNIDVGLINNAGGGTNATNVANDLTKTRAQWETLVSNMSGTNNFFIDRMYMVAAQTGQYAKHATYGWNGGNANTIGDTFGVSAGSNSNWPTFPTYGSSGIYESFGWATSSQYWFPKNNEIKPQITAAQGDQLINGLEGIVQTNSTHTATNGIRRWKDIAWGDGQTVWNWETSSTLNTSVYHSSGRTYLHISYLAPGEDLHDGTLKCDDADLTSKQPYAPTTPGGNYDSDELLHNNTQGIHGGGVFTSGTGTYPSSNPKYVFAELLGGDSSFSPSPFGFDSNYQTEHDTQWDLPQADKEFIEQFVGGTRFRFTGDNTIYTVAGSNVNSPKKLYNHTPWRKMWKMAGGTLIGMGNSVEEAATAWADGTDNDGKNNAAGAAVLRDRLEDFGSASNRRVSYMIMLNPGEDPTAGGTTYDPLTNITATSQNGIEIVIDSFDSSTSFLTAGSVAEYPAIWETEPKDNVDLDIYYEASQAHPITLTEENRELFAPLGCKVEIIGNPVEFAAIPNPNTNYPTTAIDGTEENYLQYWGSFNTVVLDNNFNGFPGFDASGNNNLSYDGLRIRFFREDGSYTTGKIIMNQLPECGSGACGTSYYEFRVKIDSHSPNGHGLSWYNCFSFGNGIESDRIRDDFNAMTLTNGVRANATLDKPYTEEHRKSGLIYSGIYNSTNGINNLNQFIMAEKITKDLNPTYGSIQKLYDRVIRQSSSLIAFCEDRIVSIISNKNALYNADGNPQVVASNAVLGDANAFVGDYGISKNPESFSKDSYRAYFTDKQRGAVLRLSMDGITPISDAGMRDWFKDELKLAQFNIIGSFDNYKNDYNLTLDGGSGTMSDSYTVTYSEDVKGWVSFKSFIQESGVSMSGDYYTFKAGKCYKHDNETRNTFYGQAAVSSTVKFIFNESPTAIKNFNTLNYDGDENWICSSVITDQQSGTVTGFIEKEGKWFNYIKGGTALDTSAFNFQGIGTNYDIVTVSTPMGFNYECLQNQCVPLYSSVPTMPGGTVYSSLADCITSGCQD